MGHDACWATRPNVTQCGPPTIKGPLLVGERSEEEEEEGALNRRRRRRRATPSPAPPPPPETATLDSQPPICTQPHCARRRQRRQHPPFLPTLGTASGIRRPYTTTAAAAAPNTLKYPKARFHAGRNKIGAKAPQPQLEFVPKSNSFHYEGRTVSGSGREGADGGVDAFCGLRSQPRCGPRQRGRKARRRQILQHSTH